MSFLSLTACVTSHNNPRLLASILGQLRYQTSPPDEILAYVSKSDQGQDYDLVRFKELFPEVTFTETENFKDWGHEKRALAIEAATSAYIGFFDDDDEYDKRYIEKMLDALDGEDVVFCDWNLIPEAGLHMGSSTAGNFFVRVAVAREIGWKGRTYSADGDFINRINHLPNVKVEELLYWKDKFDRGDWQGPF